VKEHTVTGDVQTFHAGVGERPVFPLPEVPSTGYQWAVLEAPPTLRLDEAASSFTVSSSAPGAGGVHRFVWEVLAPGGGRIHLALRREWEPDGAIEECEIVVEAQ
jgi:predicted secreted protein